MTTRTTEAEEDNDARLNLLYRLEKIKTLVEGFRRFNDQRLARKANAALRELLTTLSDVRKCFSIQGDDK